MNLLKIAVCVLLLCFGQTSSAQSDTLKSYIFGHSLVTHTPGDQSIPHWFYLLSEETGLNYAVDGQFGFLPLQTLPPTASWGFDIVPGAWQGNFADSDYDNVIITAANFIQYQAPTEEFLGTNTVDASLVIFDHVRQEEPNIPFYIYENFPEFNEFPPTPSQLAAYHDFTRNGFHDWWIELQDLTNAARPGATIKLIPVGYILSGLLTEVSPLDTIAPLDLYEDNAPHGEAVIYFLTALIHYAAIYGQLPPASFTVPNTLPPAIADHYLTIINYIWTELSAFNYLDGSSRVFFGGPLSVEWRSFELRDKTSQVDLFWETGAEVNHEKFEVEYSRDAVTFEQVGEVKKTDWQSSVGAYTFSHFNALPGQHYYRLRQVDFDGQSSYSEILSVERKVKTPAASFFPNPSSTGLLQLNYQASQAGDLHIRVYDLQGRILQARQLETQHGNNDWTFDWSSLAKGVWIVSLQQGEDITYHKVVLD